MALPPEIVSHDFHTTEEATPCNNVVIMSRARYARNLSSHHFSPHGGPEVHRRVLEKIVESVSRREFFDSYYFLNLHEVSGLDRSFLKESRLISREMERGGNHHAVYVAENLKSSIMINEEDHVRMQCLECGLQISKVQEHLSRLHSEMASSVSFSYHQRFGFLTACPSNLGTGLRVSVMMHLPGLTLRRKLESALSGLSQNGMTVRGFYGENSENLGYFFQISNERTLGYSTTDIEEKLAGIVSEIMEKELEARSLLLKDSGIAVQDSIWRAYGILSHARRIDTGEAMKLLSRLRLGCDEGYFETLTHEKLNRLVVEIQPGHLILRHGATDESDHRDNVRADLIRSRLN